MRTFPAWSLAGLLLAIFLLGPTPSRAAARTLRVMTFNVRYPSPGDGPNLWMRRRDLMVRAARQTHPDVMGTQELYKRQGDFLVARLPHYRWFGTGRRGGDGDEHMGVFYRTDRLRLVRSGNFWLSRTPRRPGSISWGHPFPRMVTWGLFQMRDSGRRFYYFNTHLPYRDQDEPARLQAAREILERLQAIAPDVPVVLGGDFNTGPDSRTHALLTRSLHDARLAAASHAGPEGTFHDFTGTPGRRIDWILYRGFRAVAERTVTMQHDGRYPSDHFPVLAELGWKDPAVPPLTPAQAPRTPGCGLRTWPGTGRCRPASPMTARP